MNLSVKIYRFLIRIRDINCYTG